MTNPTTETMTGRTAAEMAPSAETSAAEASARATATDLTAQAAGEITRATVRAAESAARAAAQAAAARTVREKLTQALGHSIGHAGSDDELFVTVTREQLHDAVAALIEVGARHVMLVGMDLHSIVKAGHAARPAAGSGAAHLPHVGHAGHAIEEVVAVPAGPIVRLRVEIPDDDLTYPSLTPLLPAAQWDERECRDLYSIVPAGHPDPRPLVIHNPEPPAAPYKSFVAHGDGVNQVPVGPIHAGIIEPGHFRFSAVGETVLYLDARLFYTHRGLEQLAEGRTWAEALPVVERACGVCTVTHATVFSRAVELLTGTEIPPRARMARVLLAEMERLYNHVGDLGNMCAGVGFNFGTSRLGWQKERLLGLNEALTGHRYLMGMVAPGGLRLDLDERGLVGLRQAVTDVEHEVRSIVRLLVRSDGFMNRLHGFGVLSRVEALRLGAVGVAARASGLADDLRRDRPADGYRDVNVAQIGASTGDVAARFHVRAQEASVSAALIADLARRIPAGPKSVDVGHSPRPGAVALTGAEGPRGASWLWLMAGPGGTVGRVHLRSASFANWPVVASVVPGNLVPDFPIINKSFELCYSCTDR
jgi:Ni,Fe-hydrogenase III large subunit/Ni,Fe-hydrogenase III component G